MNALFFALFTVATAGTGWTTDGRYYIYIDDNGEVVVYDTRAGNEAAHFPDTEDADYRAWSKKHPTASAGTKTSDVTVDVRSVSDNVQGAWRDGVWRSTANVSINYIAKSKGEEWVFARLDRCVDDFEWNPSGTRIAMWSTDENPGARAPPMRSYSFGPLRGPRIAVIYSKGDHARAKAIADKLEKEAAPFVVSSLDQRVAPKGAGRVMATTVAAKHATRLATLLGLQRDERQLPAPLEKTGDIVVDLTQAPL